MDIIVTEDSNIDQNSYTLLLFHKNVSRTKSDNDGENQGVTEVHKWRVHLYVSYKWNRTKN